MDDEPPSGSRRDHRVGAPAFLTAIVLAAVVMIVGSWPGGLGSKPEPLSKPSGNSTASSAGGAGADRDLRGRSRLPRMPSW